MCQINKRYLKFILFNLYIKFDENLSAIHAYLCADGYIIKNPPKQKNKYYYIGLRNTNLVLLKDFQEKFKKYFGVNPRLIEGERCVVQKKELYEKLVKRFESFYSREWNMPKLNKNLSKIWLRSFFDCEGWVFCKSRQNRHIGLDSINEKGIDQIRESLEKLKIKTIKKVNEKRGMYRILIYGKDNLKRFEKEIGFLHPNKKIRLKKVLEDFIKYKWIFPEEKLERFIKKKLKEKIRIKKPYYIRIISKEKINLKRLKKELNKIFEIDSKFYKRINGLGTIYYELNINKKEDITKLIKLKIIPNVLKCGKKN